MRLMEQLRKQIQDKSYEELMDIPGRPKKGF
jgi:hypothetical protein